MSSAPKSGGGIWRVAFAIAWRSLHTYVRRPDLFIPSLVFPLVFLASFAGGLSALGSVPGFHFPAGYTAAVSVPRLERSAREIVSAAPRRTRRRVDSTYTQPPMAASIAARCGLVNLAAPRRPGSDDLGSA
jgi:hypothetical protein